MTRPTKGRRAPQTPPTPPAPPKIPSGFAYHTICSDGESPVMVELDVPLAEEAKENPEVSVRFFLGHVWGFDYGASGWAHVDLPIAHLEAIAKDLADVVALAKHHGLLPAAT